MKKITSVIAFLFAALCVVPSFAQNQNEKEKTPEEIAQITLKAMTTDLHLNDAQQFYVDSILTTNFVGVKNAFDDLKKSGMQDDDTYRKVKERWNDKTTVALKKVLDDQQYIKYLRGIGKGKDYRKGKDGKYYLKSELAKMKEKEKKAGK